MRIDLEVSLDPTLGCGQAHRWHRLDDGRWEGVWRDSVVVMEQLSPGSVGVTGTDDRAGIARYLGGDDDLEHIISEISRRDGYVAGLAERCPGMRILRQDHWECLATYLLATNANVARIGQMVESVCDHFGKDLGGRHAFPTPGQILDGCDRIGECRLGFREKRFVTLAERVESGDLDVEAFAEMDYEKCVTELQGIDGVGPKVADCVALFAFEHMEAFPIDARISKVMENVYGVTGSYRTVSAFGRERFGEYAGYAQEFLYHADFIERSHSLKSTWLHILQHEDGDVPNCFWYISSSSPISLIMKHTLHITSSKVVLPSAMRLAASLILEMNSGYLAEFAMMSLSPLFFLRYWEIAASVTPNFLATWACDIWCTLTSSFAAARLARGSTYHTTISQGIFMEVRTKS